MTLSLSCLVTKTKIKCDVIVAKKKIRLHWDMASYNLPVQREYEDNKNVQTDLSIDTGTLFAREKNNKTR